MKPIRKISSFIILAGILFCFERPAAAAGYFDPLSTATETTLSTATVEKDEGAAAENYGDSTLPEEPLSEPIAEAAALPSEAFEQGELFERFDFRRDLRLNIEGIDLDSSGLTINPNGSTPTLLTVDDLGMLHELTMDGQHIRSIPMTGFEDTMGVTDIEGITHVGASTFAVVREREADMILFTLTDETQTIDINAPDVQIYSISSDYYGDNLGLEGLSYDKSTGHFYAVREGSGGMEIYRIHLNNGEAVVETGFSPLDPAALPVTGLNGIHASGGHLYLLARDSYQILEVNLQSGEITSVFHLPDELSGKAEGIIFDEEGTLYLILEKKSTDYDFYTFRPEPIDTTPGLVMARSTDGSHSVAGSNSNVIYVYSRGSVSEPTVITVPLETGDTYADLRLVGASFLSDTSIRGTLANGDEIRITMYYGGNFRLDHRTSRDFNDSELMTREEKIYYDSSGAKLRTTVSAYTYYASGAVYTRSYESYDRSGLPSYKYKYYFYESGKVREFHWTLYQQGVRIRTSITGYHESGDLWFRIYYSYYYPDGSLKSYDYYRYTNNAMSWEYHRTY